MDNSAAFPKIGRLISAIFLVAGTCIGGGMLALPVATGVSGFWPSIAMMFICWLGMTATALLLLEVSLWMEEGVHLSTMTSRILGTPGKVVSWLLYLFVCYASLAAYTAGGGVQVAMALRDLGLAVSKDWGAVVFILIFGGVIYLGSQLVGRVNSILFIALVVAYVALVGMGVSEVSTERLEHNEWTNSWMAIPLLLTSFSFQTMVPSLTPYLKRNARALRIAIIAGTTFTFIVYAIWQWLILGIVPVDGPHGLKAALALGEPATQFLREHVDSAWVYIVAEYFAFFAIVTSFLGIAFGLYDFLADGLSIKKEGKNKVLLGLLIALPTLLFATQFERIFIVALETSGGYGDTILNGLIPVLLVWIGHYYMGFGKGQPASFMRNKVVLSAIFAFFLFALGLEIYMQTVGTSQIYDHYEIPEPLLEERLP